MKRSAGFTLIELMIAVAIVGILAAVALPAYNAQVRASRRAPAIDDLGFLQLALERYRADCPSYASVTCTGFTYPTIPTGEYYTITITGASATAYTVTATAKSGTSQASDTGCTVLSITQDGTRSPTSGSCWKN